MRYFFASLLFAFLSLSLTHTVAQSETLAKLTADGLCKEYGHQRGSSEFESCMESVMKAASSHAPHKSIGQLIDVLGAVQVIAGGQVPQTVANGAPLENDMVISTGKDSQAVLKFTDGQIIALQANSSLQINDYSYNPEDIKQSNVFLSMLNGGIRVINGLIGRKHPAAFRMEARNATLGVRNTDFMVVMDDEMYSQVSSGLLQIGNEAGTAVFTSGQTAVVAAKNISPVLINAVELPPDIFLELSQIPVPDANPAEAEQETVNSGTPAPAQAATEQTPKNPPADSATPLEKTANSQENSVGQIYDATGDVKASPGEVSVAAGSQKKQGVAKGAQLKSNMTVITGEKSQAVLKFKDGQVIALQPNTTFEIKEYTYNAKEVEKSNVVFSMLEGAMRAITGLIGHNSPTAFKLETRGATLGVRGTDFMVATDDQTYSQVNSGLIVIGNDAGTIELGTGQTAAVASANTLPTLINADELPPKISSQFSALKATPVPPPTPMENGADQNRDAAKARENVVEETFCENYGYVKGTDDYQECIERAAAEGYDGNGPKSQKKGQYALTKADGGKKKRR